MDPFTLIYRAVEVGVNSKTICFVIEELTSIDVTTAMPKCAQAVGFIFSPFSFINSATSPFIDTVAVPLQDFFFDDLA